MPQYEYYLTNKRYHTIDYYLKAKYNKKVFKVPLNASFTCPNRDGSKSTGGCYFCSALGSGDFAGKQTDTLQKQFSEVKDRLLNKWPDALYIAYFQAYSNTYGPIDKLKSTFEQFIGKENVIGMSIATRPDCINEEIAAYLAELKKNFKEFWVELGLQSSKTKTLKYLNVQYTYNDFKNACRLLHKYGIDIIVHIIDGLPYENEDDMLKTIKDINKVKVNGIKIHCLNIIKNTKLATIYEKEHFKLLDIEEFIKIVAKQIATLDEDVIIHRIGADSNKDDLIAPKWVLKKLSLRDEIDSYLEENDIIQGDEYTK